MTGAHRYCALCGRRGTRQFEPTTLPGGWRCANRWRCRQRIRDLIAAHQKLAEACQ